MKISMLLLISIVSMFLMFSCSMEGKSGMNPCAANPCANNPCASNPCANNPCASNPCASNPCASRMMKR